MLKCKQVFRKFCIKVFFKQSKILTAGINTSAFQFKNFRSPIKFSKIRKSNTESTESEKEDIDDKEIDIILDRTNLNLSSGHQVYVIQPIIKWGPLKKRNTTPQLQLLESITLIKTLREWKIIGEAIVSLDSFNKKFFFGKGNLENLKELIDSTPYISAVFISVDSLSLTQQLSLEHVLGVPVFDRYTIVMTILSEHAQTKEAKLQVQLAKLPYLWNIMKGANSGTGSKIGTFFVGGDGIKSLAYRKEIFKKREAKIKQEILELRENRKQLNKDREKKNLPVVSVIGYTNCGKTSIVKALTGKESLDPQDYLFATLDVTSHIGQLPSNLNAFFVDTLGFISDIPTYLIESFLTTLEDILIADVILHVRDLSHPDTVAQNDIVIKTLEKLKLTSTAFNKVITVGNKIDLLNQEELNKFKNENMLFVSSTKLTGIDVLRHEIEKKILKHTDRKIMVIRVKSGEEEYNWLHSNVTIVEEKPDLKNMQYMLIKVIISDALLAKFKHKFI